MKIAQNNQDQQGIARAMHRLGYTNLYYFKDETKALEWFNKGITVANKNNDHLNLAQCYFRIGIIAVHQRTGNEYELYLKALAYAKKSKNWKILSDCYSLIGGYFVSKEKYNEAENMAILSMNTSIQNDIDIWFTQGLDYCELLEMQGKKTKALAFYKKMDGFKNKLKMSQGYFVYMNDVGKLETKLKNYAQAEAIFMKVLDYEKKKPKIDTFHLSFIFSSLEALYLAQEDYKKAHHFSTEKGAVRLWLAQKRQTQDSRLQMTKLKSTLDLEKKEIEISLLAEQKKEQLFYLIGAIVLAVLLTCFLVILQRNKKSIESQKTELNVLNSTKNKLFAILTHDLRSPIGSLKNYLMLIDWGALSQAEFTESVQGLSTQLNNVQTMLENTLHWSVSQMEGMKPKPEKVNIFEIIENEIKILKPLAEKKEIMILNQIPTETEFFADKNHLTIIFRNLIQNAIKFTNSGGEISLSHQKNEKTQQIEVIDNGVGIPEERLSNLFQLDKSASLNGTAHEQGTGLGLVLVKDLVEANKGKINVSSKIGYGTSFKLTF